MADTSNGSEKVVARVQWTSVEDGIAPVDYVPPLRRSTSRRSLTDGPSRRASIDPSSALPVAYRTVSIHISESKEVQLASRNLVKNSVADGPSRSNCLEPVCANSHQNWVVLNGTHSL